MAKRKFPVENQTDISRLIIEGRARVQQWWWNNWVAAPAAVVAGAANAVGGPLVVARPGKKIIVTSINVALSGPGLVECVVNVDGYNNWYPWVGAAAPDLLFGATRITEVFGPNGGNASISIPAGFVLYENSSFSFQYRSPDTTGRNMSWNVTGIEVPNEFNPNAGFKIGIVGDSNSIGNNLGLDALGRQHLGKWHWSEVLRDEAVENGVDAQIFFNHGQDGKTMLEGAYMIATGFTRIVCDALYVMFGTNDMVITKFPTETKFKDAIAMIIAEFKRCNPGKPITFFQPLLTDDNQGGSDRVGGGRMASIRTWTSQAVQDTTRGGGEINKVYLLDASQAVVMGNADYKEQVDGQHVHLNGPGSTKLGKWTWQQQKTTVFKK